MGISTIRELVRNVDNKKTTGNSFYSADNFLFFGNNGKSTITASLSTLVEDPILVLSPAGASSHLGEQYPNAIFYPVNDFKELNAIVTDLEDNMATIKKIQNNLAFDDRIELIKKQFLGEYKSKDGKAIEDWNECVEYAKNNKFPISAVALEEIDIVSSWIQDGVEATFKVEVMGEDKKNLSADWAEMRKVIIDFYSRLLKLPVKTIFSTSDKLPKEQQNLDKITPNICIGAANRLLLNLIGNVFYVGQDKNKYFVRIQTNDRIFTKSKFVPVHYSGKLDEELDVSGKPEYLWQYIDNIKNSTNKPNTK